MFIIKLRTSLEKFQFGKLKLKKYFPKKELMLRIQVSTPTGDSLVMDIVTFIDYWKLCLAIKFPWNVT